MAAEKIRRERQVGQALKAGQVGTWDWEINTNQVKWNEQQYNLFGLPEGRGVVPIEIMFSIVHPDDAPKVRSIMGEIVAHGSEFIHEFRVVRSGGEVRWLAAHARLLRNAAGKPTRMQGVNYDITTKKQMEEALKNSEE